MFMVNIFIIDDHPAIIAGIKNFLAEVPHFQVVGTAKSAHEALILHRQYPAAHLFLVDLNLPDEDGLELARKLRQEFGSIKIVFLTSTIDGALILKAMQAGANGYVLKSSELNELIGAIDTVMGGATFMSVEANTAMIQALQAQAYESKAEVSLTRREKEIVQLLEKGLTSPEIAQRLSLSTYTVDTHRKNMLQKFGVHNTQGLLNIIQKNGSFL